MKFAVRKHRVFDKDDVSHFIVDPSYNQKELSWVLRYSERHDNFLMVKLKSKKMPEYTGFHGSEGACLDVVDDIHAGKYNVVSE